MSDNINNDNNKNNSDSKTCEIHNNRYNTCTKATLRFTQKKQSKRASE